MLAGGQAQRSRSLTPRSDQGRIPFSFRIGVTGHRKLADPAALALAVRGAVGGLTERLFDARAEFRPVVVTALAEGPTG